MPDTAEILAQPNIAQAIRELVIRAMSDAGIGQAHCIRAAIGLTERIATGDPVAEAVALIDDITRALRVTIRSEALAEAADVIDRARSWAEGDLRGPRERLRAMAKDPTMVDRDEEEEES